MSITEKKKNEVYRFRCVSKGIKYDLTFYGTKKQAEKAHEQWVIDIKNGVFLNSVSNKTFLDLYNMYIKSKKLEASSVKTYNSLLNKLDDFKNIDIFTVDKMIANKLILDLKEKHSENTVWGLYKLLKSVFNFAKELDIVEKNPFDFKFKRPKKENKNDLIDMNDIETFLTVLENTEYEHYKICYLLGMGCGLRISEILGLRKNDIDMLNHKISITKQYKNIYDKQGNIVKGLGSPKTESSIRSVNIPEFVRQSLYPYMDSISKNGWLIPGQIPNKPLTYNAVYRYLSRLCKKVGLRELKTHDMRRIYTTISLYAGNNVLSISSSLGHTSIMTTEIYLRKLNSLDIKNIENIDSFMKNGIKKGQI